MNNIPCIIGIDVNHTNNNNNPSILAIDANKREKIL